MNGQNSHRAPPGLASSSAFCNFEELHLSPSESSGSHGLALPLWPLADNQQITQYDHSFAYLLESGHDPLDEMQTSTGPSDFLHVGTGSTCNYKSTSSFQSDLLDVSMLDGCQYQDLASGAGLWYAGQYENIKNETQTTRSITQIKDFGPTTAVSSLENYVHEQSHTSRTQESNAIQSHLESSKSASSFNSKRPRKMSKEELLARDNSRRCRITKGIQDLEKLFPYSSRNQYETVDKSIEYIKHLQHQLKELSQNRLGSETKTEPFISLKGLNFLLPHQMFLEELKKIFGRLLLENPEEAIEVLDSQGLFKVPMALVKALPQSE